MSRISKYNGTSTKRPPHRKRSIRLAGSGEDDGKWFRCWYCGFINNVDRNSVGSGEGISYFIVVETQDFASSGNVLGENRRRTITITGKTSLINNMSFSERHNVAPDVNSGCSFCGSLNYR